VSDVEDGLLGPASFLKVEVDSVFVQELRRGGLEELEEVSRSRHHDLTLECEPEATLDAERRGDPLSDERRRRVGSL
jgi:hypothetical protein